MPPYFQVYLNCILYKGDNSNISHHIMEGTRKKILGCSVKSPKLQPGFDDKLKSTWSQAALEEEDDLWVVWIYAFH